MTRCEHEIFLSLTPSHVYGFTAVFVAGFLVVDRFDDEPHCRGERIRRGKVKGVGEY